jgi:hypothetical protein
MSQKPSQNEGALTDDYPSRDIGAVRDVFYTLKRLAPDVLVELRDTAPTAAAVRAWAKQYGLPCDYWLALRAHWEKHPDSGHRLTFWGGVIRMRAGVSKGGNAAYEAWLEREAQKSRDNSLELEDDETLKQWLARARTFYRHRLRSGAVVPAAPDRHRAARRRHYEWFVRVQVLREPPTSIGVDRSGVRREVARIARELGVPVRTGRPGRPRRKR